MASWRFLTTASLFLHFPFRVTALPTISAVGAKFFDTNGNQFYIKGVAYQLATDASDPLVDSAQCARDAALLKTLGANTIRVYTVDAKADHTKCMSTFETAGIYVLVALESPKTGLSRSSPQWTDSLYNNYTAVVDAFAGFNNTLGFFAGNEVVLDTSVTSAAPYVKAIAIDLKAYRDGMGYRPIPIGHAGADVAQLRPLLQNYLSCGAKGIDFFGQNVYSWCDDATFQTSRYNVLYQEASGYNIPIFLSETGCKLNQSRTFSDQGAVLGSSMNDRYSGAIIYEWASHANNYGLITYPSGAASGTPTPVSGDFSNLKSRWSTLTPSGTPIVSYNIQTATTPACPRSTSGVWAVNGDVSLPTLGKVVVNTRSSTSLSSSGTQSGTGTPTGVSSTVTSNSPNQTSSNTQQNPTSSSGLSTGVKAGIAIGVVLLVLAAAIAAFLLWRRRKKRRPDGPLDLSPEGLEVGAPPPGNGKPELDGNQIIEKDSEQLMKAKLPNGHLAMVPHENFDNAGTEGTITSGTTGPNGNTPELAGSGTEGAGKAGTSATAELSNVPATPKTQSPIPITRRPVASATSTPSWANAPWHSPPLEEEPYTQQMPVPPANNAEELRILDEEERRIDSAIAESERIRALKEEKAALQAKRAELMLAKENTSKP